MLGDGGDGLSGAAAKRAPSPVAIFSPVSGVCVHKLRDLADRSHLMGDLQTLARGAQGEEAASEEALRLRGDVFPEGQFVACGLDRACLLGFLSSQRITSRDMLADLVRERFGDAAPLSYPDYWSAWTDGGTLQRTHDPAGDFLFLVDWAMTSTDIASALLQAAYRYAASHQLKGIVALTRLRGLRRWAIRTNKDPNQLTLSQVERFLHLARQSSTSRDARFLSQSGIQVLTPIYMARANDEESANWGLLIAYLLPLSD